MGKKATRGGAGVLRAHTCLPWTPFLGTKSHFLFFSFFILLHHMACGILAPWPGIEPGPLAVKAQSSSHWSAREFPTICLFTLSYSPRGSTVPGGMAIPGWCVEWTEQVASPVPSSKDPCTTLFSDRDIQLLRTDTTLRFSQQAEKQSESHFNLQIPTWSFQKYYYSFTQLFWAMLCIWDQSHFCKNERERNRDTEKEGKRREEKQAHPHLRGSDYTLGTRPGRPQSRCLISETSKVGRLSLGGRALARAGLPNPQPRAFPLLPPGKAAPGSPEALTW